MKVTFTSADVILDVNMTLEYTARQQTRQTAPFLVLKKKKKNSAGFLLQDLEAITAPRDY